MGIRITADSSGVSRALLWAGAVRGQLPYAMSQALNKAAFQISQDLRAKTTSTFTLPNKYTQGGFFYTRSTKSTLKAQVTAGNPKNPRDRRRQYLATQIAGGQRGRTGAEVKTASMAPQLAGYKLVPTRNAKLDKATGRGVHRSLWGKVVPGSPEYFVGTPKGKGGRSRSLGLYQRKGRSLRALLIAKPMVSYDDLFPMERIADQTLRRNWPTYLTSSLVKALATAR